MKYYITQAGREFLKEGSQSFRKLTARAKKAEARWSPAKDYPGRDTTRMYMDLDRGMDPQTQQPNTSDSVHAAHKPYHMGDLADVRNQRVTAAALQQKKAKGPRGGSQHPSRRGSSNK